MNEYRSVFESIQCKAHSDIQFSFTAQDFYNLFNASFVVLLNVPYYLTFISQDDRAHLMETYGNNIPPIEEASSGYPSSPLYTRITSNLSLLIANGHCGAMELTPMPYFDEQLAPVLRYYQLLHVFKILGKRGLLDLLEMRRTVGSLDDFPLSREEIFILADQPHYPKEKLTVVGRALAKHCVRDSSQSWWGRCTGPDSKKNELGRIVLQRIIDEAVWLNIHGLPEHLIAIQFQKHCLRDVFRRKHDSDKLWLTDRNGSY
ncbi:hypothetical protein ACTXT7_001286 [Hymenolepis weldensis]